MMAVHQPLFTLSSKVKLRQPSTIKKEFYITMNILGSFLSLNNTKRVGNAKVISDWAKVIKNSSARF